MRKDKNTILKRMRAKIDLKRREFVRMHLNSIAYNKQKYLTNIPQNIDKYGFCKVLVVRREVIHIKHIFTEVFVRRTIDIQKYLDKIGWSLFGYMEYITNRLRRIHYFSREYVNNINEIVKADRDKFFPTIQLYKGLNNVIVLDFDGVVTKNSFNELYKLCIERCRVEICSANPGIKESWFEVRNLPLPNKIHSCKGKLKKISKLIELGQRYDYVFYVDNEREYLEFAWLFGLQTYIYEDKKIKYFSLKSK
ncbi:MAG: hypothetical protein ACOC22_02600 [bacterium]